MHRQQADDTCAIGLGDRLVTEAYAENGYAAIGLANEIEADPGLVRRARPGREDDGLGRAFRAPPLARSCRCARRRSCAPSSPRK